MIRFFPLQLHTNLYSFRLAALLLLLVSFGASASDALHMIPLSLQDRVKAAELVVEGEVIAQRSFWDQGHGNIYTASTIRVYKVFKGTLQPAQVEVITEGGTVGLERHVFSAALQLQGGQQGVFFLIKEQELRAITGSSFTGRAYGSKQGFIRYDLQQLTAADVFTAFTSVNEVYKDITSATGSTIRVIASNIPLLERMAPAAPGQQQAAAAVISSFSPTTASAGTGTVLTINGSGFGTTRGSGSVKFRNGDDGGKTTVEPYAADYKLWTDTQIQVVIPSYGTNGSPAGSGRIQVTASDGTTTSSSNNITIPYVYSNVVEENGTAPSAPILINKNGTGGYTIRFAPSMNTRAQAREGFRRAMNSWICNTEVNWRIGATTEITKAEKDGTNVVLFTSTAANTLAQTISRYSGCRNLSTNNITWWLEEFDMEINQGTNWQYGPGRPSGSQFDFETVVLHELGHAHQLGHVIQPASSAMHFSIEVRAEFRTLNQTDIEGGRRVIQTSFDPARLALAALCKASPMVRNTEGECNLAPEIAALDALFNNSGTVDVIWTGSSEQNISSYIIERSPDGSTWATIGTVAPTGQGGGYTFRDTAPLPGTSYYRIRVTYSNSTTPLFSPRARVISPEILRVLTIYPNPTSPATEAVKIQYIVQQDTPITLQLYDYTGKLVLEVDHVFTDENLPYSLRVHQLAAGIYILRWTGRNVNGETKLVKL